MELAARELVLFHLFVDFFFLLYDKIPCMVEWVPIFISLVRLLVTLPPAR